jgi:LysM repeat protein
MQNRLVLFLIVIAVILAVAGFLLISFLTGEPETVEQGAPGTVPSGETGDTGVPVQVDGITVYLNPLPQQAVSIQTQITPAATEPGVILVTPPATQPSAQPTLVIATATSAPPPVTGPSGDQIIFVDYVVQPGDTLYRITTKQVTSIELMAVHGISSVNVVPGNTLRLPVANPNYCPAGMQPYVVRPDDNVFRIAIEYNTTTQAIASANNLPADYRIDITQVICIP